MEIEKIDTQNAKITGVLTELKDLGEKEIENTIKIELTDSWEGWYVATVEIDFAKNLDEQIKIINAKYNSDGVDAEYKIYYFINEKVRRIRRQIADKKADEIREKENADAIQKAKVTGKPVCIHSNLPFQNSEVIAFPNGTIKTIYGGRE